MTINREHLSIEELSDLVDGLLDDRATKPIQEHLADCEPCSAQHKSLMRLLAEAAELPRSVLPEQDIWPDLKRTLTDRKTLVLPNHHGSISGSTPRANPRISFKFGALLAAAAVVLITISSAITALVLRRDTSESIAKHSDRALPPVENVPSGSRMLPASFRQAETEYNRTIDELVQAVNTQRNQLTPETIRTVDHSLAVVDSAIAEARAALLADPNNGMLVDLLSASYQRKLDLLRRTSELGSRL